MNTTRAHIFIFVFASIITLLAIVVRREQLKPFTFTINSTSIRVEVADSSVDFISNTRISLTLASALNGGLITKSLVHFFKAIKY